MKYWNRHFSQYHTLNWMLVWVLMCCCAVLLFPMDRLGIPMPAAGMAVTFHMAFDTLPRDEQFAAIDWLAAAGVSRILTRGGPGSAAQNLEHLRALIAYASDRLIILPGGGINRDNLHAIARATGAKELHGSRIVS